MKIAVDFWKLGFFIPYPPHPVSKAKPKHFVIIVIYPLTGRVVGAPQMISTALWDLANSRSVHSLMLSSHLFLCLPCLLSPFTVLRKMVLARPDEREACPYHCSLRLFTMVRRFSCGLIALWILTPTSSLVTKHLDKKKRRYHNYTLKFWKQNCKAAKYLLVVTFQPDELLNF